MSQQRSRFLALAAELASRPARRAAAGGPTTGREALLQALVLARLPKLDPERIVLVAGTNGKGSTCAVLEALLRSTGHRVGLFTSPHLITPLERFRVDGIDINEKLFLLAYDTLALRTGPLWAKLTHFEALTLMALWIFGSGEAVAPVDYMIFEVGLGGLNDATNAIPHATAIITHLALDHVEQLGDTLASIARHKLGIVWPRGGANPLGTRVVHAPWPDDEISALARAHFAACETRRVHVIEVYDFRSPLEGRSGAENTNLALTAFASLGFNPHAHAAALANVRWPGRMETIATSSGPIVLSGDHNVDGMQSLVEILRARGAQGARLVVVFGVTKAKDPAGLIAPLLESFSELRLIVTGLGGERGRRATEFSPEFLARATAVTETPAEALGRARELRSKEDLVIVTGSLYLVGEVREILLTDTQTLNGG